MSSSSKAALVIGGVIAGLGLGALIARKQAKDAATASSSAEPTEPATPRPKSKFSLEGKNTVVTGAASGIGLAIAKLYAEEGAAYVHVIDLDQAKAAEAAREINRGVGREVAYAWSADVSSRESVRSVFADLIDASGAVDVLVNNAGIGAVGNIEAATEEEMDRLYRVNIKGVFNCSQVTVESMLASEKGGSIINLGSIASLIGLKDRFSYAMSKGAVLTMTYAIATDYVKRGIRCNAICPARIHTPFVDAYLAKHYADTTKEKFAELSEYQPIGRMGTPDEIASLALYLACDESCFVTGSAYSIDGGVVCNMG